VLLAVERKEKELKPKHDSKGRDSTL